MSKRFYTMMHCKDTGKDEPQYVVKMDVDGVTLRCGGCCKQHSHEIGYFAELYVKGKGEEIE